MIELLCSFSFYRRGKVQITSLCTHQIYLFIVIVQLMLSFQINMKICSNGDFIIAENIMLTGLSRGTRVLRPILRSIEEDIGHKIKLYYCRELFSFHYTILLSLNYQKNKKNFKLARTNREMTIKLNYSQSMDCLAILVDWRSI